MKEGLDAVKEGKKPEGDKREHKGDEKGGVPAEASGRRSFSSSSAGKEESEAVISAIAEDLMKGGDIGRIFSRLCDEVRWNRGEILRIQRELEMMERSIEWTSSRPS